MLHADDLIVPTIPEFAEGDVSVPRIWRLVCGVTPMTFPAL